MTTGEKLVGLSSLNMGTAMEHLLSIITGGGGGSGPVIDVELKNPDTIIVSEVGAIDVTLQCP